VLALEKMDVIRFLDLAFSSEGLFKGDRLMDALREMVGDHRIEDLPIAYTAVACDLERQREVWLTDGSLFDAIRASIAIPTVFTPHRYRGMRLLDGGLLNPVPIAPTFKDFTDLTIAVDLNGMRAVSGVSDATGEVPAQVSSSPRHATVQRFLDSIQNSIGQRQESDLGLFDLLSSSFETMQNAISSIKLATYAPDVLVQIPRSACKAYEFDRAAELIEQGYALAGEAMAGTE
jgi:NTE family protein